MVSAEDDFAHAVPVRAFMTWKENWVFPALDPERRVASLFHVSLRPGRGVGVFSAKLRVEDFEHRYVARSPIPSDPRTMRPVANERVSLDILEPAQRFRIRYDSDELSAEITYTARFAPYDFADGPKAPGDSLLGEIGRAVFPYHHYEQALTHHGRIELRAGPRAGEVLEIQGYACRDHSWGWRDDLAFASHHWVCASFDDRFVQGSVMVEDYYPHGPKCGGWISTETGNDPVRSVDTSGAWSLDGEGSLPAPANDVRYRIETVGGQVATVIAHLGRDYGRLHLDARASDRSTIYEDVQIFCDYTLVETGQHGSGVIELGKRTGSAPADGSRGATVGARASLSNGAPLEHRLRSWFAERLDDPELGISELQQHNEGFSWETYTLAAAWHDAATGAPRREGFAVRVQPLDGMLGPYDVEAQYRVHEALAASGLPVPRARWIEPDPAPLGAPFYVVDRIAGRVPVQWRPDDREIFPTPESWHRFGQRFADVHAEIHRLDWRALGLGFLAAAEEPQLCVRHELDRWIAHYESSLEVELPIIREAIEWLRYHLPASGRLVLCHGDYRIGNVMERDGELVAVLDWELAHIGDPIEDIAYAGLPLWRGRDPRISHFLPPEEYFERYEARTGLRVDPEAYRAWTVFGLVKAGACHLRGARAFREGRTRDLRLAALSHQVQHVVRHLVPLLGLGVG
jgi:aminoglycoside phosphotransferase (APT) family kinase protein